MSLTIQKHIHKGEFYAATDVFISRSQTWEFDIRFNIDGTWSEHMTSTGGLVGDFDIRSDGHGGYFFEASPFPDAEDIAIIHHHAHHHAADHHDGWFI